MATSQKKFAVIILEVKTLTIGFFIFFKKIRRFASGRIAFLLAKDKEVAAAEDSMTVDEQ